ncbi:MAG: FecCD family ABC transporter permease [Nocardioidaceae bacterium]
MTRLASVSDDAGPLPRRDGAAVRTAGLLVATAVLLGVAVVSIAVGTKAIPLGTVVDSLLHPDQLYNSTVIYDLRLPRTALGLAVGASLGLAGALMQSITRNPLADPGVLGVNAGASAAVVTAIGVFHLTSTFGYVWFALAGAALASVTVYVLGTRGRSSATPARLALAGTAISAALGAFISGMAILDPQTFDSFRFWAVGSLAGRPLEVLWQTGPFLLVGAGIALGLARPLTALALGHDTGRALGAHLGRTRVLGVLAVTLLCGGAVAAVGPVGFVGLTVPHVARGIVGPDQRWVLPYSMVLAPILLLAADVVGRVIARPGEIQVGIVTAFVGAPVFIMIARRRRLASL